jgi:hypothetical protein
MAKGQKSRASKTSNGINRGAKRMTPGLSEIQKVNFGGGMLVGLPKRWKQSN